MIADSVSDFLTRIRNGYMAGNDVILVPTTKLIASLAKVLEKNGYVKSSEIKEGPGQKMLAVSLKYEGKSPVITGIRRVSRPSARVYKTKKDLPTVMGGMGVAIISTPSGLMTNREAKKAGLGGEVICELW